MEIDWLAIVVAALIPMIVGFTYYHPKVLGGAWMRANGFTLESLGAGPKPILYGLALVFSFLLSLWVAINVTGPFTGKVTGNLAFMGVTKPVTLDVTYNGGMDSAALYAGRPAVGFSARATLKRSDFGSTRYAAFVGDEVEIIIEAEFTRR